MLRVVNKRWLVFFPFLNTIKDTAWHDAVDRVSSITLSTGQIVFRAGQACENYFFVLSGTVRVQKTSLDGHEITLYRLRSGETCELTASCLLANDFYHADAITETPVTLMLLPKEDFKQAMLKSPEFYDYVHQNVEEGVNILLSLIEDVVFGPVDFRVAKDLMLNKNIRDEVCSTHHEIATNLGTAREVVSRVLKRFEKKSWVRLSRGKIVVLNSKALSSMVN